jgi:hypothetical protein
MDIYLILKIMMRIGNAVNHQVKNGSMLGLISTAEDVPESGYSSKLETSPKLFTEGT